MADKSEDLKKATWKYVKWVLIGGIVLVLFISLFSMTLNNSQSLIQFLAISGCSLLIGGASFSTGGFMGFLFGIPSLIQNENSKNGRNTFLKYNDNLVQISDWLTKIIVGVGLTMLFRIPGEIERLGEFLAPNFGGGNNEGWGEVAALAVVFYFLLFGFLIMYFWTRTDFTTIMKEVDDDLQEQLEEKAKELEVKKQELGAVLEEKENLKKQREDIKASAQRMANKLIHAVIPNRNAHDIGKSDRQNAIPLSDSDALETPQIPTEEFKKEIELVYQSKEILDKDDLQKGRWGRKSNAGALVLEASPNPDLGSSGFQGVRLEVRPVDKDTPFREQVAFFLHDTFPNQIEYTMAEDNAAQLDIISYEAFVVGARTESGVELELDLNTVKGFPPEFYWEK